MSESQMLQHKAGIKKISPKNIARINPKIRSKKILQNCKCLNV